MSTETLIKTNARIEIDIEWGTNLTYENLYTFHHTLQCLSHKSNLVFISQHFESSASVQQYLDT